MSKTILICGHGPGISHAVAQRFGREGFRVALVARSEARIEAAAKSLRDSGIEATALAADLADPAAVRAVVERARTGLGPITAVHWNAYGGGAGDLTVGDLTGLRRALDVGVTGLVAAVQAALPDLSAGHDGAVLVTGGGFAFYDEAVDAAAVRFNAMDLAVSKAAQHKLVGLLAAKLTPMGVYVGEVVVTGLVKGTAFDHGNATLDPADIASRFWDLYAARSPRSVTVG